jgi:hypothetical protein
MRDMTVLRSAGLFLLAALAEIGGARRVAHETARA